MRTSSEYLACPENEVHTFVDTVPWSLRSHDATVHHSRQADAVIRDVHKFLHLSDTLCTNLAHLERNQRAECIFL